MTQQQLTEQIIRKQSFLCIGLDTDLDKIPLHLQGEEDPIFAFNKAIIDATSDLAVAYKPNTAFYEAYGLKGWRALQKTIEYLNLNHPDIFTIADAKRGDIGNTSRRYAKAFFEELHFNAVTVTPYMGSDSVEPFLEFEDKFVVLLGLTSNPGALDFQTVPTPDIPLYSKVLQTSKKWKNAQRLMYVVGATKAEYLNDIRKIVPDSFLLIPGVGAQGGSLEAVCRYGMNKNIGLLVNSSRGIIYASQDKDFAEAARSETLKIQQRMQQILGNFFK